jgi:hypothetical protein
LLLGDCSLFISITGKAFISQAVAVIVNTITRRGFGYPPQEYSQIIPDTVIPVLEVSRVWTKSRAELREGSRLREEGGPVTQKDSAEKAVRDIRRKTRRKFSAEEKIRIVLEGLRGESPEGRELVSPSYRTLPETQLQSPYPHGNWN